MMSTPDDAPTVTEVVELPPTVTEVVEDTPAPVEDTPAPVEDTPAPVEDTPPVTDVASATRNAAPQSNSDGQVNLLSIPINNENDALNCLIGFLSIAQRRGIFAINESAKIFECVKRFHK
jgi:hypothetical protein